MGDQRLSWERMGVYIIIFIEVRNGLHGDPSLPTGFIEVRLLVTTLYVSVYPDNYRMYLTYINEYSETVSTCRSSIGCLFPKSGVPYIFCLCN